MQKLSPHAKDGIMCIVSPSHGQSPWLYIYTWATQEGSREAVDEGGSFCSGQLSEFGICQTDIIFLPAIVCSRIVRAIAQLCQLSRHQPCMHLCRAGGIGAIERYPVAGSVHIHFNTNCDTWMLGIAFERRGRLERPELSGPTPSFLCPGSCRLSWDTGHPRPSGLPLSNHHADRS